MAEPANPDKGAAPAPKTPVGPGAQRAAAVLLGMGPELAAEVFRMLDENTVRQIALGARELKRGGGRAVTDALKAYADALGGPAGDAAAGDGLLREVVTVALGPEAARRAFEGVTAKPEIDEALGPIAFADAETLGMILAREQPQTIALVLASLTPARAGAVTKLIPARVQPEVMRRLATIHSVAPEVLREVGQALEVDLRSSSLGDARRVDGKAAVVELLRRCPPAQQNEVVAEIEKEDPDLANELRGKLFTFEDLANLSDRDVQTLIREIDASRLTVALRGAAPAIKDKVLKNMSTRAAQMLSDEIAAMGPVRLSMVEEAQGEVVKVAFGLAEQGRITVVGPSDKML